MSETLDNEAIRALLPHRFPMLLVDKMLELVPGKRAVALKNVTINEPFFTGHFPAMAVMPGVLIIESMAQVAGLMMLTCPEYAGKIPFIGEIESARFYRPVVPGDSLVSEATVVWVRGFHGKVSMVARVDGVVVAKCEMKFTLKTPPPTSNDPLKRFTAPPEGNGTGHTGEGQGGQHGSADTGTQESRGNAHRA